MFPSPKIIQLLLLYPLFCLFHFIHADPPYKLCPNTTISEDNTPLQHNLDNLLSSLSSNASVPNFYNTTIGNGLDRLHGLFLCYEYVAREECGHCIATASQDIKKLCPNRNEAVVWEENCQLRYSNASFFGRLDVTGNIPKDNEEHVSEPYRFSSIVNETLRILTRRAAFNASADMFATGEANFAEETIYALVQCTADLSPDDCNTCLMTAIANISSCCHKSRGARLLSPSCYLRYEFYDFYEGGNSTQISNSSGKGSNQGKIWKIIVVPTGSTILVVALLVFGIYRTRKRQVSCQELRSRDICDPTNIYTRHQNSQANKNLNSHNFSYFDLATLIEATDNFSDSNKLGQGGFGPVYKGRLLDGMEIAVKKLSSRSEQGSNEFTNEVLLILKLQHKNLVRLLGFCVDGEEQLLIYEYMPNGSLDFFLLDPKKRVQLNWKRRISIINGVARGMLYLHEDSRLRIIHRDLKPSNVLLDSEMNPKISDFGMARIFGGNDGEANTAKIVGTYGYMAPEFAMEGLYSIKSDVFSFGVLLLEIITGKRNFGFHLSKHGPSLLAYAWQLWKEGKGLELMDPLLADSCDHGEFLRCMHIGLLCVQEDACDRPTMSSVVVMLKSETVTLSQPQRAAFSVGRFTNRNQPNDNVDCSINKLTVSEISPR